MSATGFLNGPYVSRLAEHVGDDDGRIGGIRNGGWIEVAVPFLDVGQERPPTGMMCRLQECTADIRRH